MRDSSSAGQSVTYVSVLETYISFGGGWESLGVSKKALFIIVYISNIFSLNFRLLNSPSNDEGSQLSKFHLPDNKGER